jgi:hypothetical protein
MSTCCLTARFSVCKSNRQPLLRRSLSDCAAAAAAVIASAPGGPVHLLRFAEPSRSSHARSVLAFKQKRETAVLIQPADHLITARMRAMIARVDGEFQEGHRLDKEMARKVPKARIGKIMSAAEARTLLKKLG